MHASDDLKSLTVCMQRARPDQPCLKVHEQHVEALGVAAVQYEAAQGATDNVNLSCMQRAQPDERT